MKRICIVTPGHLSTNPRVVKEAEALSAAGYEVSVISGRFSAWAINADRQFEGSAWRLAEQVGYGPLQPLTRRLRHKAARAAAAAIHRLGAGSARTAAVAMHDVGLDLISAACRTPADLYIAHYDAALMAARLAARRHGGLYAFDAEDFHPGDLTDAPQNASANRLIRTLEAATLPGCAFMTASSPGIALAYSQAYAIPEPTVVLNVFSKREAPPAPSARGRFGPGPSVYWFSQTIGPDRGLEWAVRAVAAARSRPHLVLRGKLAAGYGDELRALAAGVGLGDRLHVLDPIAPAELIPQMNEYDLGFVGETGATPNHQIAMANKLFSYLVAGMPIVASDIPAHRALAEACRRCMTLFPLGDHQRLAEAIDDLLLDPARLAGARAEAWRLGQERFNWEQEQQGLLKAVEAALASGRAT